MRWTSGLLALLGLSLVFVDGPLGLGAYHAVCAGAIVMGRRRLPPLFASRRGLGAWTLGATLAFLAGIALIPLLWDPARARDVLVFPSARTFAWSAAYTMLVHAPLEEIFWRGIFTEPGSPHALWSNALTFYLVHVIVLVKAVGPWGAAAALPTALAGLAWSWMTRRTRSLWPALVSHLAADAAILAGAGFYFVES